jgi:protein disulfide-isomerase A1
MWAILLLISLLTIHCEEEDGVLILTDSNIDEVIAKSPILMIKFYAPWCGHCKQFAPEYAAAAKKAKEKGYVLAQVDATVQKSAASKYKIQGFPTIKLLLNGDTILYEGERKTDAVIAWIDKKVNQKYDTIEEESQISQLKRKSINSIILFTKPDDKQTLSIFEKAMKIRDDFEFYVFTGKTPNFIKQTPTIIMYKNYDDEEVVYDGMDGKKLTFRRYFCHSTRLYRKSCFRYCY